MPRLPLSLHETCTQVRLALVKVGNELVSEVGQLLRCCDISVADNRRRDDWRAEATEWGRDRHHRDKEAPLRHVNSMSRINKL